MRKLDLVDTGAALFSALKAALGALERNILAMKICAMD